MKFTCLIGLLLVTKVFFSQCPAGGFWVWPSNEQISRTSIIILKGYSLTENVIERIHQDCKVFLSSDRHIVEVKKDTLIKGDLSISQLILKPQNLLIPGETYTLQIEGLEIEEKKLLSYYTDKEVLKHTVTWKVTENYNEPPIKFTEIPKFLEAEVMDYGISPAVNSTFEIKTNIESTQQLMLVERVNEKNQALDAFYMELRGTVIHIGHGICSGAFSYQKDTKYKVRFKLVSPMGKESEFTEWVNLPNPFST